MSDYTGSDEESGAESVEGTWRAASSSSESKETEENIGIENTEIDVVARRGADVSLTIHEQLDLSKLQKIKTIFFADGGSDTEPELDIQQFIIALRTVLDDTEDMTDEDLEVLFMKIDANGSGSVDWDEFTGFLLQLDEGNRNMAAAAHMVDLRPLPGCTQNQRGGGTAAQHKGMIEKVINVERPGISAYVTCGRDGTIRFWHKSTFAHVRSINYLDTIKAACEALVLGSKGWDGDGGGRCTSSAPAKKAIQAMKNAWVYDIQQMPLGNRIAVACLDRSVSFYEMLTGEFVCRIGGLRSVPTCIECLQVGPDEQLVLFGDLDGILHFWSFGRNFYIPGPIDMREATDLRGSDTLQVHRDAVSCLSYVPDLNTAVTCGMDGKVHFIDLAKRRILRTFGGHGDRAVFTFGYCQQHRFVASAGMGREVVFWNPYTMHVLARGDGHASSVKHCLIDDRCGRIITVSADKGVRCWDSATLRCIQSFKDSHIHRPEDTITAALWDDSRSSLVLAGSEMGVWKNMGAIQTSTRTHEAPVSSALYNKHFHQVVSGDVMGNVQVWMVETGQLTFRFSGAHGTSKISCMCFDASERRLLTGANDGTVKMWNFSNGKVLQQFGSSVKPGRKVEEGNEVSGVVYCRDNRGTDQAGAEYVATCSWDKLVRVFSVDDEDSHQGGFRNPHAAGADDIRTPARVFPVLRAGGGIKADEGHSADILAIAHCGHQQIATGGFDGQIFLWGSDSGRAKFSMRPSEHDVSQGADDVSSIGGLTSVAGVMERLRKKGLVTEDGDTADSGGYLERMEDLLADDHSTAKPYWDGREFFADERTGGSDDGSGTAAAAETPAPSRDNKASDNSGDRDDREVDKATDAVSSLAATKSSTNKTGGKNGIGNDENAAPTAVAANPEEDGGKNAVGIPLPIEPATASTIVTTKNSNGMVPNNSASLVGGGGAADADGSKKNDGSQQGSVTLRPIAHDASEDTYGVVAVAPAEMEDAASLQKSKEAIDSVRDSAEGIEKHKTGASKPSQGGPNVDGKAEAGDQDASDDVADSAVERLENAASHTVDCLLFVRCHQILVSGTASGDLHFWDTATGTIIFGAKAQHPHDAGISALSSSEGGTLSTDRNRRNSSNNNSAGAAAAAAVEIANLALYTACEEGFVKTWKLGAMNINPNDPGNANEPPAAAAGLGQKALLVPLRQWQAHETRVSSIDGANYRGKADLLVSAGEDCYVHLWTVAGAHVGTFGQLKGAWSLGSRVTWRISSDQALLNARGSYSGSDDQTTTVGNEQSTADKSEREERRLRRANSQSIAGTAAGGSGKGTGESPPRRHGKHNARGKEDIERDLEREKEETRRYQEKRYYLASQNRVQRKLLRGRLGAFCMSRDYYKQDQLQEASNILQETAKKNILHPPGGFSRPGLSKNRITSILRNTYNQVSFQLRLHQQADVHELAEGTLTKRKSRRRLKQHTTTTTTTTTTNRPGYAQSAAAVGAPIIAARGTPGETQNSNSENIKTHSGDPAKASSLELPAVIPGTDNVTASGNAAVGADGSGGEFEGGGVRRRRDAALPANNHNNNVGTHQKGINGAHVGSGLGLSSAMTQGSVVGGGIDQASAPAGRRSGGHGGRGLPPHPSSYDGLVPGGCESRMVGKDAGNTRPAVVVPSRPALPGASGGARAGAFRRLSAGERGGSEARNHAVEFAPLV